MPSHDVITYAICFMLAFGSACRDFEFLPTFRFGPFSSLSIPCLLFALASFLAIVMAKSYATVGKPCLASHGPFDAQVAGNAFRPRELYIIEVRCPHCNSRVGKGMKRDYMMKHFDNVSEQAVNMDLGSRLKVHLRDVCPEKNQDESDVVRAERLQLVSQTKATWYDNNMECLHPDEALVFEKNNAAVYVFLFVICEKRAAKLYFVLIFQRLSVMGGRVGASWAGGCCSGSCGSVVSYAVAGRAGRAVASGTGRASGSMWRAGG